MSTKRAVFVDCVACENGGYLQEWKCPDAALTARGRPDLLGGPVNGRIHLCGIAGARRNCGDCNRISAREAKKNQLPPDMRRWLMARDGFACVFCAATVDLQIDHIMPRSLGGRTDPDNLQTLCRPCNSAKGARI